MRKCFSFISALALVAGSFASTAQATIVIIDNSTFNGSTLLSAGNANFRGQNFTPNVAGVGATDSVTANSPLNNPVQLQSISIVGRTSAGGTTGQIFLDIYSGTAVTPLAANYIGSSNISIDVEALLDNQVGTFTFNNLNLNPATTYSYYFSTTNTEGSFALGRVEATDGNSGVAGAQSSYSGGTGFNATVNTVFDQRFTVTFESVPEPSSLLALGVVGVGLVVRRRRK